MAIKRMLSMKICDSDAFLDMPQSTQNLYFHLNLRADDDGFIGNPKRIQRMINASDDDLKLLIAKRFILIFESGVIVIKHWRMHNTLLGDRYNPTPYQDELSKLTLKKNKSYKLSQDLEDKEPIKELETNCKQNVNTVLDIDLVLDTDLDKDLEEIYKSSDTSSKPRETKHKYGTYKNVLLTDDEITKLKDDYLNINIDDLINWFSAYIEEKGYKSKSHNLAIRRWVIEAYSKSKPKKSIDIMEL